MSKPLLLILPPSNETPKQISEELTARVNVVQDIQADTLAKTLTTITPSALHPSIEVPIEYTTFDIIAERARDLSMTVEEFAERLLQISMPNRTEETAKPTNDTNLFSPDEVPSMKAGLLALKTQFSQMEDSRAPAELLEERKKLEALLSTKETRFYTSREKLRETGIKFDYLNFRGFLEEKGSSVSIRLDPEDTNMLIEHLELSITSSKIAWDDKCTLFIGLGKTESGKHAAAEYICGERGGGILELFFEVPEIAKTPENSQYFRRIIIPFFRNPEFKQTDSDNHDIFHGLSFANMVLGNSISEGHYLHIGYNTSFLAIPELFSLADSQENELLISQSVAIHGSPYHLTRWFQLSQHPKMPAHVTSWITRAIRQLRIESDTPLNLDFALHDSGQRTAWAI